MRSPSQAELLELAWKNQVKTTCFSDLAKRIGSHRIVRSEVSPRWTDYYFPDGSSLRTYGRGKYHRYEVYCNRRAASA